MKIDFEKINLNNINIDTQQIFFMLLGVLILYKFFDFITYGIIIYFFYYINPEFCNKIFDAIKKFLKEKIELYSTDILNKIKDNDKEQPLSIQKNVIHHKTLAIDDNDLNDLNDFSRNYEALPSGNRNVEAFSTSNKQFDGMTND